MTSPEPQIAAAEPPLADRDSLLARVGPERQRIFALVRQFLDEFEAGAPWSQLYHSSLSDAELLAMQNRLLAVVASVPERMDSLFDELKSGTDEATIQEIEDAEFFLTGIHDMVANEWRRLQQKLDEATATAQSAALTLDSRAFLCELAADLKGKYTSSLMGATAAVVAEGVCDTLEAEPVLFAEKAQEFARNQRLFEEVKALRDALRGLADEVPFAELLAQWQAGNQADAYALAELTMLRGRIGRLLTIRNRRALYSGDFHQVRRREQTLAERLDRIRLLQQAAWSQDHPTGLETRAMAPDLCRLTLEIAALLDVDLLETLVGAKAIKDLRALATSTAAESPEALAEAATRMGLATGLRSLIPLFGEEDMKTFFDVLAGAIANRASLRATAAPGEAEAVASEAPSRAEVAAPTEVIPEAVPDHAPEAPAAIEEPPAPVDPQEAFHRVMGKVRELRSQGNPQWKAWQMLKRILQRDYGVPRAMLRQADPYIRDVLSTVVPDLEAAVPLEVFPAELPGRLRERGSALLAAQQSSADVSEIKALLDQVDADLEELGAVVDEYLLLHMS